MNNSQDARFSRLDEAAEAKFRLGKIVATRGALDQLSHDEITWALSRHVRGDWGELDDEDMDENERALKEGSRLFSVYGSARATRFYVITEHDRSVTTVLLPSEY